MPVLFECADRPDPDALAAAGIGAAAAIPMAHRQANVVEQFSVRFDPANRLNTHAKRVTFTTDPTALAASGVTSWSMG